MSDLISRKQAIAKIEDLNAISFYELNEHSKEAYSEIMAAIKNMPSAEKTGKWIVHTDKFANGYEYFGYATCSECGEMFYAIDTIGNKPIWDYCPYCGARMVDDNE